MIEQLLRDLLYRLEVPILVIVTSLSLLSLFKLAEKLLSIYRKIRPYPYFEEIFNELRLMRIALEKSLKKPRGRPPKAKKEK